MTALRHALMASTLSAAVLATPVRAQRGPAPVDPAKATTIRHLLDLTGAARLALSGMESMVPAQRAANPQIPGKSSGAGQIQRSEEHTSELQSRPHLVCRLLLGT